MQCLGHAANHGSEKFQDQVHKETLNEQLQPFEPSQQRCRSHLHCAFLGHLPDRRNRPRASRWHNRLPRSNHRTACMTGTFRPEMPLPSPAIFSHNISHILTSVSVSGVAKMGIFSRTRDIIAANVTDLLDKADDPAKMIRMIILEMEETLVEVRATAARNIADQKEMRRHIVKLDNLAASWTEKAELALSKDREDLAKAALVERQKATTMADQLKAEIDLLDEALRTSEEDIAKLQGKLREARARQNSVMTRLESAENRIKVREAYAGSKVEEAFARFDILERRVDFAEGRADALYLGQEPKSLEDEINELKGSEQVDADLAALKANLANRG
jgi:phage shock protein A